MYKSLSDLDGQMENSDKPPPTASARARVIPIGVSASNMTRTGLIAALAVMLNAASPRPAAAQTASGGLSGVVRDSSGAVVPAVTVTATHQATNAAFAADSNERGQYVIRPIPVGRYTIAAALPGFRTFQHPDVDVRVDDEVRLDVVLTVGALSETVVVTADATPVDAATSTLKTVVDRDRIDRLPLNGRNPTQLMQLVAGVLPDGTGLTSGTTYPGAQPVSSNGARGNTTNYILDGGSNNDHYNNAPNPMPNPDALQEFSVQTNSFSAEYGRNAGAIVNALTRSGTNDVHGLGFIYWRDRRLNATSFFTPGSDDGLSRKQYGGTFGGPIARDRSFYFVSYQATTTSRLPVAVGALVPTAAMRRGDFSEIPIPLRNPFTGAPFSGNQIPTALFNAAALKVLDRIPLPNPGPNDNPLTLRFAVSDKLDDRQMIARVDHTFGPSHRTYGRVWVSRAARPASAQPDNAIVSLSGQIWQNTIVSVNDTLSIGSNLLNNVVVTFNRTKNDNFSIYPPDYPSLGINIYNDKTPQWVFGIGGYFGINTGDTNAFTRNELQLLDTVRWARGRHDVAIGADYSYGQGDITNNFRANGRFAFSGAAPFTGDSLADFFVGKFASFEQGIGEYKNTRLHAIAGFVQDTFRVRPELTLNLGLRWDPFLPYTDSRDHLACYRPGERSQVYVNAPVGAVFPGDSVCPSGGYDAAWTNLGPRVGMAYDPQGDGRTSLRAGYGIFYDRPNTIATNSAADQAPFGTVYSFFGDSTNSLTTPYAGRINPFPADPFNTPRDVAFVLPHTMFSYDPRLKNGRLQDWNVTVDRAIRPAYLLRVTYAGSYGDRLAVLRERNPAIFTPGATTATTDRRRPLFPDFGSITTVVPAGRSRYHSLQAMLDKRFSKGFSVLSSYTLSRTLDLTSENKQTSTTETNPFDAEFDWGPANFDRRHRWVTSWLWNIPGTFGHPAADRLLAGWSLAGIYVVQSGLPFSIVSGVDNARSGTGSQRADRIGDPNLPGDRSTAAKIQNWFNTAAFAANALGTFGNTGRNAYRGPGYQTLDIGVRKAFATGSQMKVELRLDSFNALNSVNFGQPVSSQNSRNFGKILTAGDPRIMQVAIRLAF